MKKIKGGLENVRGFTFSAVSCGIKYKDRLDYCLIFSRDPCNAAGVFTQNKLSAAPVKLCRERISFPVHGILINANNANACTGSTGYSNAIRLTAEISHRFQVPEDSVLMASTGVIGVQLPVEKMISCIPALFDTMDPSRGELIPEAIMTTDTVQKFSSVSFKCGNKHYNLSGTVKGAGMIAPDMATLLSFILTDFPVPRNELQRIFKKAVDQTFNRITIDGDTSTNDSAIILSPVSDNYNLDPGDLTAFEEALKYVLHDLAIMVIKDGEGTTKLIKVNVQGAVDDSDALTIAKAIAESLLVKTAIFGKDPNWGRIACAAGYSGAEVKEDRLSISFGNTSLLKHGAPVNYDENEIIKFMEEKEIQLNIDIGIGNGTASMYSTDLSYEYVRINAEYTT